MKLKIIPSKLFHRRKVTRRQKKRQDILSTRAIFTICGWMHRQSKIIIWNPVATSSICIPLMRMVCSGEVGIMSMRRLDLGMRTRNFMRKKVKSRNTLCMWTIPRKTLLSIWRRKGNFMVLEMILPICYCSIQKCQWKIWHIRQNGMSPVRHFCWKMSVMRGADVMM